MDTTKILRARTAGWVPLLVIGSLALSACSGSSKSTDAATPGSTTSAGATGAADDGVARAQAVVDKYTAAPTDFPPLSPLKAQPKGKKFILVACGAPECVKLGDYMDEAAKLIGASVETIPAGGTAQTISAAFETAIQKKPDVLMEVAIDPTLWGPQLKKAKAQKIPVLAFSIPEQKADSGIDWQFYIGPDYIREGEYLADWAIADSKGTAAAVTVYTPEIAVVAAVGEGVQKELTGHCAKCSVDKLEVPATDLGTPRIPNRVVSYLQQHPKTKYVITGFGSMNLGLAAAFKQAGLKDIKLFTQGGSASEYQAIKAGDQATILATDLQQQGWIGVDGAAKLATGQAPTNGVSPPFRFLDKSQLTFDLNQAWVAYPDFKDQYKKLWGVS